jgi:hypothetical protein
MKAHERSGHSASARRVYELFVVQSQSMLSYPLRFCESHFGCVATAARHSRRRQDPPNRQTTKNPIISSSSRFCRLFEPRGIAIALTDCTTTFNRAGAIGSGRSAGDSSENRQRLRLRDDDGGESGGRGQLARSHLHGDLGQLGRVGRSCGRSRALAIVSAATNESASSVQAPANRHRLNRIRFDRAVRRRDRPVATTAANPLLPLYVAPRLLR